jgi:superfamily II DNA or RNA helicase
MSDGIEPEYYKEAMQQYNSYVLPFYPRFPQHLKAEQAEAVQALLNKSDLLCILPTGYSKTVCMLVPSIIISKVYFCIDN